MNTPEHYHAAMYAALGKQCQMSARGYTVIFAKGHRLNDRADLSGHAPWALAQLQHAGIDPELVTPHDLDQYREWRSLADYRHIYDMARILITRPRGELQHQMSNGVELQAGCSPVYVTAVKCLEVWDPEAKNVGGGIGAYRLKPDSERIRKAIEKMKSEHPEFAHAPIVNNAGAELVDVEGGVR